jgi:opacity protein-like surface antigen
MMKAIHADLGFFGPAGLSGALGFRYWFASFTLGLSGLMKDIPNYSTYGYDLGIYPQSPLPANYDAKSYPALIVTGDFSFYYEVVKKVTGFGSIGFYSQQDTVLAWDFTDDVYYFWKNKKSSGVCFGLGAEFDYNESMKVGLGYHTKRGLFARLTYFWF